MSKDALGLILGNNIRSYRMERSLTQEQLAEKVGISTSFCANLERGNKSMSIATLKDMANALQVSIDCLLS